MLTAPGHGRLGLQLHLADVERRAGGEGMARAVVAVVERVGGIGQAVGSEVAVNAAVVIS